jgi:hypothetical protein
MEKDISSMVRSRRPARGFKGGLTTGDVMRGTIVGTATAAGVLLVLLAGGPAEAGPPALHDHPAPTPTAPPAGHAGHSGHAGTTGHASPVTATDPGVSDGTRLGVLGGFGAVNAAVVGVALVLRRKGLGRRTAAR